MGELIIAFGLFLFIEGILYALFPSKMKNMLKKIDTIKSNFFNISFIFDGNKAYKIPSINRNSPKAIINSFIEKLFCFWFDISKKFEKFTIR